MSHDMAKLSGAGGGIGIMARKRRIANNGSQGWPHLCGRPMESIDDAMSIIDAAVA